MSDDVLVSVENVSKRFCRSLKRSLWYGLQDLGSEIGGRGHGGGSRLPQSSADVQLRQDEFWAVKDVSFELRRGECLGLIGRNGSGKSTLLRMLSGLIKPDAGIIKTSGQINALIALGAGFNPILSGYENIQIASSVNFQRKLTKEKIEEIIDFSGLEEFIYSPVQSYSSGMVVRLGFAVATAFSPDILILDEVLAVGDEEFRAKCYQKIGEISKSSATIFVSHNMNHIYQLCNRILHLERGFPTFFEDTLDGINKYDSCNTNLLTIKGKTILNKPFEFFSVKASQLSDNLNVIIDLKTAYSVNVSFRVVLYSYAGSVIAEANTLDTKSPINLPEGSNNVVLSLGRPLLKNGRYYISVVCNLWKSQMMPGWSYCNEYIDITDAPGCAAEIKLPVKQILLNQ